MVLIPLCAGTRIHPAQTRAFQDLRDVERRIVRILNLIIGLPRRNLQVVLLNFAGLLDDVQHMEH